MPAATLTVVPAAGHTVHLENPVAWRAAVEGFLTAAPPAARSHA
jgi:pimeloyl-ACP methyl ester carboxylesterase